MNAVWWLVAVLEAILWGFGWLVISTAPLVALAVAAVLWTALGVLIATVMWEVHGDV